jgi:hypothetical protein
MDVSSSRSTVTPQKHFLEMCVSNSLIVWQKPPMLNNRVFSLFPISLHLIMGKRYLSRIRTCSVMPSTSRVANCYPKPPGVYLRLTHIIKGLKNAATACTNKKVCIKFNVCALQVMPHHIQSCSLRTKIKVSRKVADNCS